MYTSSDEHVRPELFAERFTFIQEAIEGFDLKDRRIVDGQVSAGEFYARNREARDEGVDGSDFVRLFLMAAWPDDHSIGWGEDDRTWEVSFQAATGYEKAKAGVNHPVGKEKAILHQRRWPRHDEYADRPYLFGRLYHDVVDKLEAAIIKRTGKPIVDDDPTPLFVRFTLIEHPKGLDPVWHMRLFPKQPPRRAG